MDRFCWQRKTGAWIIKLDDDRNFVPITNDLPSIEVGHAEDIPNALVTIKRAIEIGELDAALEPNLTLKTPTK